MNKIIITVTIFLISVGALLASSTLDFKETRALDDFDKISVAGNIEVVLVKSNQNEATVDVSNGETSDLKTEVNGKTLRIKFKDNRWNWGKNNRKGYVTIRYKSIKGVSASAGCEIESDDVIEADAFDLDASSGSDTMLEINATKIDINVSSGASLELSGKVDYQKVDVSSGGGYDGYDLISKKTRVNVSSGGGAEVFASEEINAKASSGGGVKYKGDPSTTDIDADISGSIRKR